MLERFKLSLSPNQIWKLRKFLFNLELREGDLSDEEIEEEILDYCALEFYRMEIDEFKKKLAKEAELEEISRELIEKYRKNHEINETNFSSISAIGSDECSVNIQSFKKK